MPVCSQLVPWASPKTSLGQEGVQTHRQHQPAGAKGQWSPTCWLTLWLSPPLHPCPASPPDSHPALGRCPRRGTARAWGRPDNTVPADAEQIGFPMVIGPVQSRDTDLFVPGRTRKGSAQRLGPPRGARAGTLGCWDRLRGAGSTQRCPHARSKSAKALPETLLFLPAVARDVEGPPRSPRELSPCATSSTHPCIPCGGGP